MRPREFRNRKRDSKVLTNTLRDRAREKSLLVLTKANSISTVHRASYLDYVGVKTFDSRGRANGEHRFPRSVDLSAYHMSPRDIPCCATRCRRSSRTSVCQRSHDAKALATRSRLIHATNCSGGYQRSHPYPGRGIVNLYERHQVRLFVRRDLTGDSIPASY
ncbi:MAG: NAD-glutamate dehydrogenase [Planctomycetes bacterium]|nr:NAD-glutamate dehydrogenase [Planctomycetota bacterium]